jgi:hypothetical protein
MGFGCLRLPADDDAAPVLDYGWVPGANEAEVGARLRARARRDIDTRIRPHPAGPPTCWCRPPLPGLWVAAFARGAAVDARARELIARTPGHEAFGRATGVAIRAFEKPTVLA